MKRLLLLILCVPIFLPSFAVAAEHASVPGEFVIEVANSGSPGIAASVSGAHINGASILDYLSSDGGTLKVAKPLTAAALSEGEETAVSAEEYCLNLIKENPGVITACTPNYILHANATSNDPSLSSLWGMSAASGIDAPRAWEYSTGSSGVVVAIIDTGVDYTHPDLAANIWTNPGEIAGNGLDDDGNGYVDDVHGINAITNSGNPMDDNSHGTHVAGTIGGVGNNGVGIVGVNWTSSIMGLKFLNAQGSGSIADAIKAINYIVMMKNRGINIKVANNSWGGGGYSQSLFNAIQRASDAGIIFAAAAGNEANDNDASPSYPASYDVPNVVSVAAVDSQGNLASFSNYGASEVDIAAPGVEILSSIPGNKYAKYSGTSMATPHVAGAFALLLAKEPTLSVAGAIDRMYQSGRTLSSLSGAVRTGRTLSVGRMLAGDTSPIPDEESGPVCNYTVTEIGDAPDTSADAAPVVVAADELNYYTVNLPFAMTWDGASVTSISLSPNGVVYMNHSPSGWDYQRSTTAPRNSVAALHTDLYPVGTGNGVKVALGADSVTINWTATHYAIKTGSVVVRLTLHADGRVDSWYNFTDSTLENFISDNATVALRGASEESVTTYSTGDGKVRNGLGIRFSPTCSNSRPTVREVNIVGQDRNGRPSSKVTPGKHFAVSAYGTGDGTIKLGFTLGTQQCKDLAVVNFTAGTMLSHGTLPRKIVGGSTLTVRVYGHNKQSKIRVNGSSRTKRTRRLSSRALSSACGSLVRSIH